MMLETTRLIRRVFDGDGVIILVSLNTLLSLYTLPCSFRLFERIGGARGGVYNEVDMLAGVARFVLFDAFFIEKARVILAKLKFDLLSLSAS